MAQRKAKEKDKGVATVRYTIDGDKAYDLNLDSLTLGERIEVEEFLGMPWGKANQEGWLFSEKGQAIFALIAVRRRRPTVTLEDILSATELKVEFDPPSPAASKETPGNSGSQA